jgi:hypothetical protein
MKRREEIRWVDVVIQNLEQSIRSYHTPPNIPELSKEETLELALKYATRESERLRNDLKYAVKMLRDLQGKVERLEKRNNRLSSFVPDVPFWNQDHE